MQHAKVDARTWKMTACKFRSHSALICGEQGLGAGSSSHSVFVLKLPPFTGATNVTTLFTAKGTFTNSHAPRGSITACNDIVPRTIKLALPKRHDGTDQTQLMSKRVPHDSTLGSMFPRESITTADDSKAFPAQQHGPRDVADENVKCGSTDAVR